MGKINDMWKDFFETEEKRELPKIEESGFLADLIEEFKNVDFSESDEKFILERIEVKI